MNVIYLHNPRLYTLLVTLFQKLTGEHVPLLVFYAGEPVISPEIQKQWAVYPQCSLETLAARGVINYRNQAQLISLIADLKQPGGWEASLRDCFRNILGKPYRCTLGAIPLRYGKSDEAQLVARLNHEWPEIQSFFAMRLLLNTVLHRKTPWYPVELLQKHPETAALFRVALYNHWKQKSVTELTRGLFYDFDEQCDGDLRGAIDCIVAETSVIKILGLDRGETQMCLNNSRELQTLLVTLKYRMQIPVTQRHKTLLQLAIIAERDIVKRTIFLYEVGSLLHYLKLPFFFVSGEQALREQNMPVASWDVLFTHQFNTLLGTTILNAEARRPITDTIVEFFRQQRVHSLQHLDSLVRGKRNKLGILYTQLRRFTNHPSHYIETIIKASDLLSASIPVSIYSK